MADEPTSSINSQLTEEFLQIVSNLKEKRHIAIVMASHDPLVIKIADTTIKLSDGKIV